LEDLHSKGVLRAIGVSNFLVDDLKNLAKTQTIPPAINQMLLYVGYHEDDDVIAYCAQNNIVYEAYSPLDEGGVLNISVVVSIAEEHNVSPAQVALRWISQLPEGMVLTVQSHDPAYDVEDMDIFDFFLTEQDMATLTKYNQTSTSRLQ